MPKTLGIWEWGCPKRGDAHITVTAGKAPPIFWGKIPGDEVARPVYHNLQYSSQIVETEAVFLEFSPTFLHSLFPPFSSLRCAPFLPQCWATRTLEHWEDCKHPDQHWRGRKSHKCFKICDEYCSSVMIRNLALYAVQPKVIRNLRWYRPWILDFFFSRLICKIQPNLHVRPPVVNDKLRKK